ncbi:hypothetical protein SNEBB_010519 [Seison nebaliae]|nr:hypothetical protein SNEBB_010519 [Seison nebaliae]
MIQLIFFCNLLPLISSLLRIEMKGDDKIQSVLTDKRWNDDKRIIFARYSLDIRCESFGANSYAKLYLVSADDYDNCHRRKTNRFRRRMFRRHEPKYGKLTKFQEYFLRRQRRTIIKHQKTKFQYSKFVASCTPNKGTERRTILVQSFIDVPGVIFFQPNKMYYVITTSDGTESGINNFSGGLCKSHNIRAKIFTGNEESLEAFKLEKKVKKLKKIINDMEQTARHMKLQSNSSINNSSILLMFSLFLFHYFHF